MVVCKLQCSERARNLLLKQPTTRRHTGSDKLVHPHTVVGRIMKTAVEEDLANQSRIRKGMTWGSSIIILVRKLRLVL